MSTTSEEKPVQVVAITTDSVVSYRILSQTLADPRVDCRLMVILPGSGTDSLRRVLGKVYRRSGFRMVAYKSVGHLAASAQGLRSRLTGRGLVATPVSLADRLHVPVVRSRDCNDSNVVRMIADLGPEILLSVNVYQRMQEPLLGVPSKAALNTHFGMLPEYKGMSPVIWAMAEGENVIGLTIHKMVVEFDEGEVVNQETLQVNSGESVLGVTLRGADRASRLLLDSVLEVAANPEVGIRQDGPGSYYSLPTKGAIRALSAQGRKLWRWTDLSVYLQPAGGIPPQTSRARSTSRGLTSDDAPRTPSAGSL